MLSKCRVTVLRRSLDQELVSEFLDPKYSDMKPCEQFAEGQEFIVEQPFDVPDGFCSWAWADIRHSIMRVACGGEMPFLREPGVEIAGCTDWFRPVLFKVERLDD